MTRTGRGLAALALVLAIAFVAVAVVRLVVRDARERRPVARASTLPSRPSGNAPVFSPHAAVAMRLDARPLDVSPDGVARWLVRVAFADARGAPTTLLRGGDFSFAATGGDARWQTRLRFGGPAAIVATRVDGPLAVVVRAEPRRLGVARAATDTRSWAIPRVVARALGPHLVRVGWFPATTARVRIVRTDVRHRARAFDVMPPASTFRDGSVTPGARYRYAVTIAGRRRASLLARVPPELPAVPIASLGGKGMWLAFSAQPDATDYYATLDPRAIVARAHVAGLREIVLRTAYGPFDELVPGARRTVDVLLDAAAAAHVAVIAWTVPRSADADDVACDVATAAYRTARGHGFSALALDVERGDDFMGNGAGAFAAMASDVADVRAAVGPRYALVATVEDPALSHLDGADVPYAAIAAKVDALQPMAYWHAMSAPGFSPRAVRSTLERSYARTRALAGRAIPIDVGGETTSEGRRGAPSPDEVVAAIRTARGLGALGVTFFEWRGTTEAQWRAIAATPWRPAKAPGRPQRNNIRSPHVAEDAHQ